MKSPSVPRFPVQTWLLRDGCLAPDSKTHGDRYKDRRQQCYAPGLGSRRRRGLKANVVDTYDVIADVNFYAGNAFSKIGETKEIDAAIGAGIRDGDRF